jgi:LCP family protein required for cell wall assembly
MSPPNPENDSVHKGLHQLGQQIEGANPVDSTPAAPPSDVAEDPVDNPVEKGLHELGRQIEDAKRADGGKPGDRRASESDQDAGRRGPAHAAPKKKRSGRRTVAWVGGTLVLVIVLIAGAAAGYGWYLNHEIHRIDLKNLTSAPVKGADAGTENILMIGSTDRCALKVQNPAYGLCSQGVNGVNSDVVMILHLNPANSTLSILSIPRDLFVPNARADGANKIDAALYQGPDQLIKAIEEDFGIPIQHFVELNFDSFINVVNALGGIKMYFPEPVFDAYSGLNIQTTGCIALNGTQALQVVRARHLLHKGPGTTTTDPNYWTPEPQSDLARIRRDHEFLRVLAAAVKAKGLSNPITDQQLVAGVVGQLTVDSGLSATDMISLVLGFHDVNVNGAPQLTVPVAVDQFGSYDYKGGSYGDIEFPVQPTDHNTIDEFLGLKSSSDDTYTGGALPSPSTVTVSVMNGSGAYNQATDTANSLQALGFHIGTIGDTTPVGREAETVVYYSSKAPAELAAAQTVANSMSGAVIMAVDPSQVKPGSEVTVVTGTDFSVNPPPTTTTPTSAGGTAAIPAAPSTTTTAPSSSSSAFAPPTPTVEPLQAWDPRSCTPSGGEGA